MSKHTLELTLETIQKARKAFEEADVTKQFNEMVYNLREALNAERNKNEKLQQANKVMRDGLEDLVDKCAYYRRMHDTKGDGSIDAGMAWDLMRKSELRIREMLKNSSL